MTDCNHARMNQVGRERCYMGSVAVEPYTASNPAAHGNIEVTEECARCGAQRRTLINGRHEEHGPFGPSRAEREREESRAQLAAEETERRRADAIRRAEDMIGSVGELAVRNVFLRLDRGGYVVVPANVEWADIAPDVIATPWFRRAQQARQALVAAQAR
jgi:hypothetical protein